RDPVDDVARDLPDAVVQPADHPRREALVHEEPQLRVTRRIHRQHHQALLLQLRLVDLVERDAELARVLLPFVAELADVVAPGDAPEVAHLRTVDLGMEVDGRFPPQQVELIVRYAVDERVEVGEVDVGKRERHRGSSRLRSRTRYDSRTGEARRPFMHDLVIRGGTLVDGTGAAPIAGDVAIDDGVITVVGKVDAAGEHEIDASGMLVTPGFVDVHTHYDGQVSWDPLLEPSTNHG